MSKGKLALAALTTSLAVLLTACGAGTPLQAGRATTPPTSAASTSPSSTAVGAGSGSVPGSPTATPSAALIPQLDQVGTDLGALDTNLSVANSDLTNPQGDS